MAAEPPVRLVDGTFTYKKDGKDKTFVFHANYIKYNDTILLEIQGYSKTVFDVAKDLLLTHGNNPGREGTYMTIKLSRMEYNIFITTVLNKGIQLSVLDRTGKYKLFPGTWTGKIKDEIKDPFTNNEGSNNNSSGGRRRTRRRKHKRRSTRRRHHRR